MAQRYESVELVGQDVVQYVATAVLVAALTAALAQFSAPYPLSSVPITLQTAGVFVAGLLLGPVWGALSLVFYLGAGVAGAPVFAGGSAGFGVITGPTGGYLLSFPLAAALIGGIAHRRVRPRALDTVPLSLQAVALLLGVALVYAVGSVQLALVTGLPMGRALFQGGIVFVPGDALKAVAVLGLLTGDAIVHGDHLPG